MVFSHKRYRFRRCTNRTVLYKAHTSQSRNQNSECANSFSRTQREARLRNVSTRRNRTQEPFPAKRVRPLFMGVMVIQNRTRVRESAIHACLGRHRLLSVRNQRIMPRPYLTRIQGITVIDGSGSSPGLSERTEKFRGKRARIGQRCGRASPFLAEEEIAGTPANAGRKSETLPRRKSPKERSWEKKNGGAEGDRTPDLMNAIHALSQLSYSPMGFAWA